MTIGLLGKKIGMTQIFDPQGKAVPVTILELGPCTITDIKNKKSHGYEAIQIGYLKVQANKLSKAQIGHFNKWQISPLKYLQEYKINSLQNFKIGQNITINDLSISQTISISGISIGRGFTGYQKRHHFSRGPMSHGSKNHRQPGSIGAGTTPGRVFAGKRMAGRMGGKKVTIKNIHILDINTDNNTIVIKGSIPGKPGNIVSIYQK
uniref:Large ribosomal subunit protein uL3c n=2 Tax=Gracilariopsis TaxID=2781 RepID=A0A1C9CF77_9FLOR|nr:ribosomal protein L3 [Gracilariopsis lemaneiformis]YP_009294800.1 ribosomal protein L3 [Gracilariopsis chorda]AJO68441.1 ribosomal protein L3 [Gracilariopsis lemaneiformis]AML79893.1 ribosomal protein L3 [Gracilariopsis lemaneiformis]AOM67060.1 ribosomal protein L3 [Gracilariopsis chorda]UAD88881.1 ribosomal protein L3 [Gracilariopsis chorda]